MSINLKNIRWARVGLILYILIAIAAVTVGLVLQIRNDAPTAQYYSDTIPVPVCEMKLSNGECIQAVEIGYLEESQINAACYQKNCSNMTEKRQVIISLIVYNHLDEKKIIFIK